MFVHQKFYELSESGKQYVRAGKKAETDFRLLIALSSSIHVKTNKAPTDFLLCSNEILKGGET